MTQPVSPDYDRPLIIKPGDRLHALVALLCDTYCDDLTDARIAELIAQIESWRWCNAAGKRVDR